MWNVFRNYFPNQYPWLFHFYWIALFWPCKTSGKTPPNWAKLGMKKPQMNFNTFPNPFFSVFEDFTRYNIWGVSRSSSASWLNACVGWSKWFLHLSPEQSLASIRAASGGASATEWEWNRPDCVGREALARDQVPLKPPLILQCAAELFYSPTQGQTPAWPPSSGWKLSWRDRPSKWWGAPLPSASSIEQGERGDWCRSEEPVRRWRLHVVSLIFLLPAGKKKNAHSALIFAGKFKQTFV